MLFMFISTIFFIGAFLTAYILMFILELLYRLYEKFNIKKQRRGICSKKAQSATVH